MNFQELCPPAKIYFYVSILIALTIFYFGAGLRVVSIFIVFIAIWILLINKICIWGYTALSWIVAFSPIVISIAVILILYYTGCYKDPYLQIQKNKNEIENEINKLINKVNKY